MKYEAIASVLRQCDRPTNNEPGPHLSSYGAFHTPYRPRNPRKMTREQVFEMKCKPKCKRCGKYGHWYNDYESDGTLKPNTMSSDQPITNTNIASPTSDKSESTPAVNDTVRFNMAKLSSSSNIIASTVDINKNQINVNNNSCSIVGPMLDDGAPYSAIGIEELRSLYLSILPNWNGSLESIPEKIADRPFWQYGVGAHARAARRILGSVILNVNIPGGYTVQLRHLVLDGSSNWVIGRNITKHSNIIHMNDIVLQIPYAN